MSDKVVDGFGQQLEEARKMGAPVFMAFYWTTDGRAPTYDEMVMGILAGINDAIERAPGRVQNLVEMSEAQRAAHAKELAAQELARIEKTGKQIAKCVVETDNPDAVRQNVEKRPGFIEWLGTPSDQKEA